MTRAPWPADAVERSIAILGRHNDYNAALAEIRATVRDCDSHQLSEKFARHARDIGQSKRPPTAYLRQTTGAQAPAPAPYAAPVNDLDYDQDHDTTPAAHRPSSQPPRHEIDGARFVIFPDLHAPYHDERAWQSALRVVQFVQPTHIIVMGDFADFYCVSSHDKSPARGSKLKAEISVVAEKLSELDALGCANRHICLGNHEYRLDRFIARKAPELHGLVGTTTAELLSLADRGWTWTNYGDTHRVGATIMSHEFGDAGPHALKRALEATRSDCMIGHTHLLGSLDGEHPATGRTITATSFGWLGNFAEIDYASRTKIMSRWRHGVGVGFGRADGTMRRECVRIIDGQPLVVDGQAA